VTRIEAIGLEVELFADAEVTRWDGGLLQFAPPVEIGVWYGADQTLERWREGAESTWPGIAFAGAEELTLCGAPARRVEARIPTGEAAVGGFPAEDGGIEYRTNQSPAKIAVVAALEHRGTPILLSWTVEAARRDELREAEQRFFAALKCA
jgi:hypothetical protein